MTDSQDEHGSKIASLETWRDQMNDQFRNLNESFSSGLNEIKTMIRSNEEIHRREISSVKSSIEDKTKPQTNIILQVLVIGLMISGFAVGIAAGRMGRHEDDNNEEFKSIAAGFEKLRDKVYDHHGDGHPEVQNAKLEILARDLGKVQDWVLHHESTVSSINATQNATTKRNQDDIKDLKDWQRYRQSGSDQSNTEQAERIRALERAVYGREELD